jgi:hypothetical protein
MTPITGINNNGYNERFSLETRLECRFRVASRSFRQTVQMFVALQRRSGSRWTKASLREKQHSAFRAAWNLTNRMDAAGVPTALRKELRQDPIFTLWSVASAFLNVDDMDRAVALFLRKKPVFAATFYTTDVRL